MIRETQAPFLRVRAQILQRSLERRVTVFRRSAFARLIVRGLRRDSLRPSMARLACRRAKRADLAEARRQASEGWLGRRDSNPNNRVQSAVSYR